MGRSGKTVRALAFCAALGAAACTPTYRYHGYIPPEGDLGQVAVGQTTRDAALALLGRPTAEGLLNDQGVFYVQSRFRHYGPLAPTEVERQLLVVSFDGAGVVSNVERFGLEDGQVVTLSRRVTDDGVQDSTFLRQLLGALGNFDAGRFLGAE